MTTIQVGKTTFRDTVADSNPIFRVIRKLPNGIYECVSEGDEYAGVERYFSTAQLRAKLKWEENLANLFDRQDDFWATRVVGEVLHYCNGFKQYIRGEVIKDGDKFKLKPTAMVGDWRGCFDQTRRMPNGTISYGYHAKKIIEGGPDAAWQPSDSCVYEAPGCSKSYSSGVDPRTLPALDLSFPPITSEEEVRAKKEQKIDRVREIINTRYETSASADEVLAALREVLMPGVIV